jgi:hypothetical protein
MASLRDPRLELFARELAAALNDAVPASEAAELAGKAAGYPVGRNYKTFAANCRKRSQREDVQSRVNELRAPGIERAEQGLGITTEYLLAKLDNLTNFNIEDYLTAPGKRGTARFLDISAAPRHVLGRLSEVGQEVVESGSRKTLLRTKLKGYNVIDGIRLMAQIKGLMAPERREMTLRPANNMTDDELARIAAGGRPRADAASVDPK